MTDFSKLEIKQAKPTAHRREGYTAKCPWCGKRHWLMFEVHDYQFTMWCNQTSKRLDIPYKVVKP